MSRTWRERGCKTLVLQLTRIRRRTRLQVPLRARLRVRLRLLGARLGARALARLRAGRWHSCGQLRARLASSAASAAADAAAGAAVGAGPSGRAGEAGALDENARIVWADAKQPLTVDETRSTSITTTWMNLRTHM